VSGAAAATEAPDAAADCCSGRRTRQRTRRKCWSPKISIRSVTSVRDGQHEAFGKAVMVSASLVQVNGD
jgi:hypothetical protein